MTGASSGDIATALFGKTRRNVLALLFGRPESSFYLREIAARAGRGMSQVQKELEQLVAAGLVIRERRANQVHFRANPEAPIYAELRGIVTKTFGIADVLRRLLTPYATRLRAAFIFGSIAKGTSAARSDVDLLWIGELRPSEIVLGLAEVENRLARKVSVIAYSEGEFATLAAEGDHFVSTVLGGSVIWLIGNPRVLDELRRSQSRKPRTGKAAQR
jgi:predicted nucleotidyltransferase